MTQYTVVIDVIFLPNKKITSACLSIPFNHWSEASASLDYVRMKFPEAYIAEVIYE